MLIPVSTENKSFEKYRSIIGDDQMDEIYGLASQLKGSKVLHVNATAFGGGVAELLTTMVPLMNDLGLETEWQIMQGDSEFYDITKKLHNSLQGMQMDWTTEMWDIWKYYNDLNAGLFEGNYDYVVIHDPQPAGVLHFLKASNSVHNNTRWIWRCHIDTTDSNAEAWGYLRPYVDQYDAAIFTLDQFVKDDLLGPTIWVIPPAIDPLSPKNSPISPEQIRDICSRYSVDPDRPLVVKASRMDAWKDPVGSIEAFKQVKSIMNEAQFVFLVAIADDDPEGWEYYSRAIEVAGDDSDIHILPNVLNDIGDLEVNAFQTAAHVIVQKSIKEGFGLAVTEALWKSVPVVAGNAGGIPLQVIDGTTGYLVETVSDCASGILTLLQDSQTANRMGANGREHVRSNFLITRLIRDYLRLFNSFDK